MEAEAAGVVILMAIWAFQVGFNSFQVWRGGLGHRGGLAGPPQAEATSAPIYNPRLRLVLAHEK